MTTEFSKMVDRLSRRGYTVVETGAFTKLVENAKAGKKALAAERERCARIADEWKIPKGHVLDHPMHDGELEIVMQVRMGIAIAITK